MTCGRAGSRAGESRACLLKSAKPLESSDSSGQSGRDPRDRNIQIVATWTNIQELCSSSAGRFVYLLILDERQNILLPRLCTKVCVSGSIWFSGDSIWLSVCLLGTDSERKNYHAQANCVLKLEH